MFDHGGERPAQGHMAVARGPTGARDVHPDVRRLWQS